MIRAVALLAVLTVAAAPSPAAAAPTEVAAPTTIPPAPAPSVWPEIGIGALQLVVGFGAEIGGGALLVAGGLNGKTLGEGDYGNLMLAASILPALAGAAVCGMGHLSNGYRGRCWTTFLGAYAGATLGVVLGFMLAPEPNPDDTVAFVRSMTALVGVIFITPVGAVIGHHVGKQQVRREPAAGASFAAPADDGRMFATPVAEPRRTGFAPSAPRLLLPLVSVSW